MAYIEITFEVFLKITRTFEIYIPQITRTLSFKSKIQKKKLQTGFTLGGFFCEAGWYPAATIVHRFWSSSWVVDRPTRWSLFWSSVPDDHRHDADNDVNDHRHLDYDEFWHLLPPQSLLSQPEKAEPSKFSSSLVTLSPNIIFVTFTTNKLGSYHSLRCLKDSQTFSAGAELSLLQAGNSLKTSPLSLILLLLPRGNSPCNRFVKSTKTNRILIVIVIIVMIINV